MGSIKKYFLIEIWCSKMAAVSVLNVIYVIGNSTLLCNLMNVLFCFSFRLENFKVKYLMKGFVKPIFHFAVENWLKKTNEYYNEWTFLKVYFLLQKVICWLSRSIWCSVPVHVLGGTHCFNNFHKNQISNNCFHTVSKC